MTFFQRIFGNNGNNNRKEQKSNTPQKRQLRIEPLECREMLSMNPLSLEVRPEPSDVPLRADALLTADSQGPAKNIILMIGDGMGFNTAQLGLLGNSNVAALLNDMFPVSLGVTTYGLTENALYYLDEDYGYDPTRYWNGSNVNNRYQPVSGQGVRTADSEQAITAMVTGEKISPQGVSWNNLYGTGGRLENIADIANEDGKMTGAVTTVPASHATPAGVGAHNPNRNLYQVLFDEMIENLDLVFGGGDPTGPATSNNNTYIVGASTWNSLTSGTPINGTSYELLRSKEDFQAYADGTKDWADSTKDKVAGVFNARDSRYNTLLQQGTAAYDALPDLTTMSLAALNILNTSDDGFFVMLEGGGIDWAAHAGVSTNAAKSNLLAEVNDYFKAVLAVYEWITVNDMWENTLLIVTADHETGDVWGAGGAYNVPTSTATTGFAGLYTDHTNALVPLWAAGAGSDLFEQYIYGIDTTAANKWHAVAGFNGWDGSYIDNTSIFDVMYTAMTRDEQPSTVVTTLDDTVNPRDGKISLREAIEYAQPGDTITFATSQHGKTIKLGGNELYIDKNITINATGTNITISADGKSRVFNIDEHATVTLMGVTITGGYTTSGGGGIYNGGTLTVMNSVIFDNSAFAGGGIYNSGTLKITNSTISDNSATNGGGICSNGVLELRNTIVVENSGSDIDRQSGTVSGFNNLTAFDAWDVSINNILYNSGILLFVNAASGNYRLASGSQAIDKGNNSYVIGDTDLAGTPRIVNDIVDIGAYEYSVLVAPVNFLSTDRTAGSVTLTWNAQGNLTGYTLEYKKSTDLTWTVWTPAPTVSATSATITGLTANTAYDFRLTATNASGSASSTTEATTLVTPPVIPGNFRSTDRTSNSVTLAWNTQSNLTGYTLEYKKSTDLTWTVWTSAPNASATSATITDLAANTKYDFRLTAKNAGGSASSITDATTLPPAPANFISTSQTTTSITLAWNAVPGATGYVLQYKRGTSSSWKEVTVASGVLTATVTGLRVNTAYNFRIQAINAGGPSDWATVNVATKANAPTAPVNFRSTSQTSNSVTLSWNSQSNLTSYTLEYKLATASTWTTWTPAPGTSATTATITDLVSNSTYNFRLTAINTGGSASSTVNATTLVAALATPTNFGSTAQTLNSVTLAWGTVTNATGYVLQYKKATDTAWTTAPAPTGTSATIIGLAVNTAYNFRVRATNAIGSSDWVIANAKTLPAAPTAPANFRSTTQMSNSIALAWDAQPDLSGYILEYKKSTDSAWTVWTSAPGVSATSATITGLTANTAYDFQLTAMNASGSAFSTTDAKTGPIKLPTPTLGNVLAINSSTISVAWSAVSNANGYTVHYATNAAFTTGVDTITVDSSTTTANITGLNANTLYYVRITATGTGAYTDSSLSTTKSTTTYPGVPTNFRSTAQTSNSVALAWDSQSNLTRYVLEYKKSADSTWTLWTPAPGILATSATITGLAANTTYDFQLTAMNASGGASSTTDATTNKIKLTTPTLGNVLALSSSEISVAWNADTNASGYVVEYATNVGFTTDVGTITVDSQSTTTVNITGLNANTLYYVRITATGTGTYSNSNPSTAKSATTNKIKLPVPTLGNVLATGSSTISVAWNAETNASGYVVEYATNAGFTTGVGTITISSQSTTSTTVTGLNANTLYYVRITATGTGTYSNSSPSTAKSAVTDKIKLTVPTLGNVTATGSSTISVAWNAVSNAGGYTVQYATNAAFTAGVGTVMVGSQSITTATITGLKAKTLYYVRVTANGTGAYSGSDPSAAKSAITQTAPTLNVTGSGTFDTIDVNLLLRYLFNYRGEDLTRLLTTQPANEIVDYIKANHMVFDIDGDGKVNATDANLLLRWLFGYTGDDLTRLLITSASTRTMSEEIIAYIESVLPTTAAPAAPVIVMNPILASPVYEVSTPTEDELYEKSLTYWEFSADTTSSGPIRDWEIHWGDGSENTQILGGPRSRVSVAHFFREPGTYTVTASTTDFFGIIMTTVVGTYTVQARVMEAEPEFALQEEPQVLSSLAASPLPGESRIEFVEENATEAMRLRQMLDLDQRNFGQQSNRVTDAVFADSELFADEWFDFGKPEEKTDFWNRVFEDDLPAIAVI